jgi:tetratricopeptide (TPR) repeat protein
MFPKDKKYLRHTLYLILSVSIFFGQDNLKSTVQNQLSNEARTKDSILNKIKSLNNDTVIIDAFIKCFELTTDYSEQQDFVKQISDLIEKGILNSNKNQPLKTALLNRRGLNYMLQYRIDHNNNKKDGKNLLLQARSIFKETGNKQKAVETYLVLAGHYSSLGEWMNQYEALNEGLLYAQEQKFHRGISRFYIQFQFFYSRFGDTLQTLEYLKKAIELEKVINDPTREARGYFLAGSTYSKLGKHDESIKYLKMSIESYKKKDMQQKSDMGQSFLRLGEEYVKIGKFELGLKTL